MIRSKFNTFISSQCFCSDSRPPHHHILSASPHHSPLFTRHHPSQRPPPPFLTTPLHTPTLTTTTALHLLSLFTPPLHHSPPPLPYTTLFITFSLSFTIRFSGAFFSPKIYRSNLECWPSANENTGVDWKGWDFGGKKGATV